MINTIRRDTFEKLIQVTQVFEQELTSLSTNRNQIIVMDSGHYMQWGQPQYVIDAIQEIVEQVRVE